MLCRCGNEASVKSGQPVREGEKVYWKQIFVCNNPNCSENEKEIGERLVNIFDETEIVEKPY